MALPRATSAAIAANLKALMDIKGLSQAELARQAGIAQRTISTLLDTSDPTASNPRSKTLDQLAAYFGMPTWQLLIPNLPIDVLLSKGLARLVHGYRDASPTDRESFDTQSRPAPAPGLGQVDQQLLARSLETAMSTFRAARKLPDDRQLAAAAAFVYAHVATGQKLKDAEKEVKGLLDKASEGADASSIFGSSL